MSKAQEQPSGGRILALDLGRTRIGIAVSDPLRWTAQPVGVMKTRPVDQALAEITRLVAEYEAGVIVLGMPYNMNGSEGEQAVWVRRFGNQLARKVKEVQIVYWDERLTSVASESLLVESGMSRKKRKSHRDKIAAALILQSYLEYIRRRD